MPRPGNLCKRVGAKAKAPTFSVAPLLLSPHTHLQPLVLLVPAQHATTFTVAFLHSHTLTVADSPHTLSLRSQLFY
jgi:hypothetical protein